MMHKKDAASVVLTVWMLTLSGLLYIFNTQDLRLFITTALVGFFIIVYLIHPTYSRPGYIRNINRMAIACTGLFGLVIVLRILELVGG